MGLLLVLMSQAVAKTLPATGDTGTTGETGAPAAETGDTGVADDTGDTGTAGDTDVAATVTPSVTGDTGTAALDTAAPIDPATVITAASLAGEEGGVHCAHVSQWPHSLLALMLLVCSCRRKEG